MKIVVGLGSPKMAHLVDAVVEHLKALGYELVLCGTLGGTPTDYITSTLEAGELIGRNHCEQAILFCNTGTGVTLIANKMPNVRAALCVDPYSAKIARQANNANVLVLGIRLTGEKHAIEIVDEWLRSDPADAPDTWKEFHRRTDEVESRFFREGASR
jgi:ribose 5-phosphate isomerase B